MNVVPPVSLPNIVVHAASQPAQLTREERQQDLLMHQMIRATVEEGGQEKALLQFGDRKLWVANKVPLRAGDQLSLQVVETHPELKLRILDSGLLERLGRSLYLLGSKFDVPALARSLTSQEPLHPRADVLHGLVANLGRVPVGDAGADLKGLAAQLGLGFERQILSGQAEQAKVTLKNALMESLGQLSQQKGSLEQRLRPLLEAVGRLPQLLSASSGGGGDVLAALPADLKQILESLLTLAKARPGSLDGARAAEIVAALGEALPARLHPEPLSLSLRLQLALAEFPALAAAAEGELKVSSLSHLDAPQKDLLSALLRLVRRDPARLAGAEGEEVARRLNRFFEQESASQLTRTQERADDALRHLELWQMCRARLAEIGVDFLPLPFDFLEQGFLLARRHPQGEQGDEGEKTDTCSLSLFLNLEGLGRLQIDCLYQEEGLYVRFLCQNGHAASFLGAARDELQNGLGAITLLGASFAAGAEDPAQALIQRLIPAETSIFNAKA